MLRSTFCNSTSRILKFRKWKCYRCAVCKFCNTGSNTRDAETKDNSLIKCSSCLDSYHFSCAKKLSHNTCGKTANIGNWICHNCLKCTSCGIQLSKSHQNYRKLSTDGNKNNPEKEMLCLECFKRRQKGSYCPVCFVCYDDNDWDTKVRLQ
jgi:hypothetical protein